MGSFVSSRTLNEYPRGAHRWTLLGLTVLATILASFEFQLAPILPIILPYLHMSHTGYGFFVMFAVLIAGVSAFFGGPLADRYGRVMLIDASLGVVCILIFANLLIVNIATFVIVRASMAIVGGLMAGAGAALVRDMSPRLSRALAFGFFTIGPVGANWLANFIAGATLPIYHTWQSQIWITGFLGLAMYLPILLWLKDLSPVLRLQIFKTEIASMEAEGRRTPKAAELPASTRDAFAKLLVHSEVWILVLGMCANLTLYIAIQSFGPLMLTEAFKDSAAEANRVTSYFWLANLLVLITTGYVSDRLQVRKPIAVIGATLATILMAVWAPMFTHGATSATLALVATLMGCFLAIGYVPWAAQFSETLEDISPALQATGWAFFGLALRAWIAISAPLMLYIAAHHGWGIWIEISLVAMTLYITSLFFTRDRAAATRQVAIASPAVRPATAK
ncbi:MAG TPA: MFS transporter [Candidatus Binataceae bacterium]|nr:MFS transporter [Candidatus Binataceae bacterium]